jgi:hypothetical protein
MGCSMVFQSPARVDEIFEGAELGPFSLGSVHGLPEQDYQNRKSLYLQLEKWFDGREFDVRQTQSGRVVDKYPIRMNPIRGACYKHAFALWGETSNDNRPLAIPGFTPDDVTDKLKDLAKVGQNWLTKLWSENHAQTLMMKNGLISQYLGGSVFKSTYVPSQTWRRVPIRVESIYPANFVGIPMSGDDFRLEEAWFINPMAPQEAMRRYPGMNFEEEAYAGELVYRVEYWNPEYWDVTVNGRLIPKDATDPDTGKKLFYQGDNPFKVVPATYIPHIRERQFYGTSLITENVQGISEEINKRMADYGDAVSDDSHRYYVIKNSQGRPEIYELAPGLRVVQLPSSINVTGKEESADMNQLGPAQASESMHNLGSDLWNQFLRETFLSPVAYGEDEGSQRSGRTLDIRFWPLMSHIGMERTHMWDGLAWQNEINIRMGLAIKEMPIDEDQKRSLAGLTPELLDMRTETRFAPLLPRDREMFITELVNRASANLGSLEHLLSLIDDIEDPKGMYQDVVKQLKDLAKIDAETQKAAFAQQQQQGKPAQSQSSEKPKQSPKPQEK